MHLLTIIGNAAVDPNFRKKLLAEPLETAREYGFQLTKFEAYLLKNVFEKKKKSKDLKRAFEGLQAELYKSLPLNSKKELVLVCPRPPCFWSLAAPDEDDD